MQNQIQDDEINLLEYWNVLWRGKWLIIFLCSVAVIAAMIMGFRADKYYKSETVIMSSASEAGGLAAALSASPLGAFAGAAGLQTPADKVMVFLKSRTISETVIKHFDLLHVFYQEQWDPIKKTWLNPEKPPLMMDAVKMLTKSVSKFSKSKEGAITISVEWKDPKLTADIANYYVNVLTGLLNEKSISINIQVVDRAIPAERKSKPLIRKNMMLAGMMGLFISVFLAFFLEFLQKQKQFAAGGNGAGNGKNGQASYDEVPLQRADHGGVKETTRVP